MWRTIFTKLCKNTKEMRSLSGKEHNINVEHEVSTSSFSTLRKKKKPTSIEDKYVQGLNGQGDEPKAHLKY